MVQDSTVETQLVMWYSIYCLAINTTPHYYLRFDCTILYHLIVSNTTRMSQLKTLIPYLLKYKMKSFP